MAKTVDDETYGERRSSDPDEVGNGNPGKPQSEYEIDDPVVTDDPAGSVSNPTATVEDEPEVTPRQ